MESGHHHHNDNRELAERIKACNVQEPLATRIIRCVEFHSSAAPGLLVGAIMVDYALELLGASSDDKLFAVCETPKCMPDAPQVIAHITTGNGRLKVLPIGRFAITVNPVSTDKTVEGVRVYVDLEKLKQFPVVDAWFNNRLGAGKRERESDLQREIFTGGRQFLSYERVRVPVTPKEAWKPVKCPTCGETVPDYLVVDGKCAACGPMKYYEKI